MSLPPWTPLERVEGRQTEPAFVGLAAPPDETWMNERYLVQVTRQPSTKQGFPPLIHLSIKARDRSPLHDWRDFQLIKNQLIGEEAEAVELYPAESRLVDTSNQFHLWCIEGIKWPFGFNERFVAETSDFNTVQRPWEPGLKPKDAVHFDAKMLEERKRKKQPI